MLKMYFYTSLLAHSLDAKKISSIITDARFSNKLNQVSGILLFDGARFLQYIEGEEKAINALKQKINLATSHHHIKQLNTVDDCDHRIYAEWTMGYVYNLDMAEDLSKLVTTQYTSQLEIMQTLKNLTDSSDIL